ncbi:unnamed protein product [Sphenostylis stenocarpa]|uniref:SAM domain-containing protein n=1 Tax=Sphenostylis stenocarpa TaxID=92480 RepID=A0AA86VKE3_9FABA|nr:unnamed protein product [Sphenostylis stenocarpa]
MQLFISSSKWPGSRVASNAEESRGEWYIWGSLIWEMNKGQSPEPLDFFIWTVEDVGLWLETINLGSYRQIFKENGVNGEYLEGMSMFTTEQILRFIRRCHMKWGDFITLCKELRRIKDKQKIIRGIIRGLSERGAEGAAAMVGTSMPIHSVLKGCKIQQTIKSCFLEAGTMIR